MDNIAVTTAQFEHTSGEKAANLAIMDRMAEQAATNGSSLIAFHECCISGYTIARSLDREQLLALAEYVPNGPSTTSLIKIARRHNIAIAAGLFERDDDQLIYNTYVCVNKNGLVAKHRKLHPFISPYLSEGKRYTVFELNGWKCGILICYDNNIIENVRATNLLGADIILMPHVTMCTPSSRPGAGFVDPQLWKNRKHDPTSLRLEFNGMKGRQWLMKWLPARAYDNGAYVIFANPIGMDADQLKNGCSMIIDPFGDIIGECRELDNDMATALITADKVHKSGGYRYKQARKPGLYRDTIGSPHEPEQNVSWLTNKK